MDRLTGDSILNSCDPVTTNDQAEQPIITPLLPIKGLRHDICGNLTEDAISTIMNSVQSLGIAVNEDASRDAILQEARTTLCRIYAQYTFLLNSFTTSISRSEKVDPLILDLLKEKLQMMNDILSLSRYILSNPVPKTLSGSTSTEGFQQGSQRLYEQFRDVQNTLDSHAKLLNRKNLFLLKERALETSTEKNVFASRQLNLYSFMNIVAIGLIFYIISL
jgi:hypothetical protein